MKSQGKYFKWFQLLHDVLMVFMLMWIMGVYPGVGVMNWLCDAGRVGPKCRLTETALRPPQSESESFINR